MTSPNITNRSSIFPPLSCRPFDPYWIYALLVPFLGVIFNGLLLIICILFRRQRPSASVIFRPHSSHPPVPNVQITDLSPLTPPKIYTPDHYPTKPEFSLNWFVANCALSTLLGSFLRVTTTLYLFTHDYVLCGPEDPHGLTIIEILVYIQYSVFSVAYLNFLIVLNLDKLIFILKPLHYRAVMTRNRVTVMCTVTWFLSLAWFPLYFANSDEDVVLWGTILVTVLMIGPSIFCLISSIILAVVVFRLRTHDRKLNAWAIDLIDLPSAKSAVYWAYFKSSFRLFQAVLWTCVTSLPHPISIIIAYYLSEEDPTNDVVVKIFVGYLSIAFFSGTPLMIFFTYPVYWKRFKDQFLYRR